MTQKTYSYAAALAHALDQAMAVDARVVLLGEDIREGVFGATNGLAKKYDPSRVLDMPISETAFTGMAVGAAMTGLRPVVEIMFCDFMGVCFDQIINQAAKARFLSGGRLTLPLVIRTTMGAGDGSGAMHSQSLAHLLTSVPGLRVAMPSTPADAAGLLLAAIADDGPVIFFEHKGLYAVEGPLDEVIEPIPFGEARQVLRGSDVTLVALSAMVKVAETAADTLAEQGISADIIDPRTVSPIDMAAITESVERTGRLVVVDEGAARCGLAADIAAAVQQQAFAALKAPVQMVTPPHTPVPYARAAESAWLPDAEAVIGAVKRTLSQSIIGSM